MPSAEPVLVGRVGAVGSVTLNRPDAGNAIDLPLARALLEATADLAADPKVRCLVLRANGRMFCAGGDVRGLHAAGEALPEFLSEILAALHPAILRLATMDKPLVTAIQGPAAGAGVALAAVGDIVLSEPDAHFTMAYSRIGLTPDGGATWLLTRLVGLRRAQELALANRRLSAAEAAAMGLITRVVSKGALAAEADAVAETLTKSAVGALGATKRLLLASGGATLEDQLAAEARTITAQAAARESREGIAAFLERREPDFMTAGPGPSQGGT